MTFPIPLCRFGGHSAVVKVSVPKGCACFPDDTQQDLCMQHLVNAEPLGGLEIIGIWSLSWEPHLRRQWGTKAPLLPLINMDESERGQLTLE